MSKPSRIVLLASLVLFLFLCSFYWFYTVEDAYISYRYAKNLINGYGLVYNPGERVEGYTNFLWVVLLAAFREVFSFTVISKTAGVFFGCLTLVMLGLWPGPDGTPGGGVAASLMLSAVPGFALWSVAGLETSMFTALITLGFLLEAGGRPKKEWLVGLIFGTAGLTRPEGYLFLALLLGEKMFRSGYSARILGRYLAGFSIVAIPHIGFRAFYYGTVIPNTFWVKAKHFQGGGWAYFKRYLAMTGGVAAVLSVMELGKGKSGISNGRVSPVLPAVGYLAYVFKIGGDWMPFGRFLIPALPLLFISCCNGLNRIEKKGKIAIVLIGMINISISLVSVDIDVFRCRKSHYNDILYWEQPIHDRWETIGRWLKTHVDSKKTLCTGLAGIIPFYAELKNIDRSGLTDPEIARVMHRHGSKREVERAVDDIVLSRRPDIILVDPLSFVFLNGDPVEWRGLSWPLLNNPVFLENYRYREEEINGRKFFFFERKKGASRHVSTIH